MTAQVSAILVTLTAGSAFWAWFSYRNALSWKRYHEAPTVAASFRTNAVLSGALSIGAAFWGVVVLLSVYAPSAAGSDAYAPIVVSVVALITIPPALLAYESHSAMLRGRPAKGAQWAIVPIAVSAAVVALLAIIIAAGRPPPPPFAYTSIELSEPFKEGDTQLHIIVYGASQIGRRTSRINGSMTCEGYPRYTAEPFEVAGENARYLEFGVSLSVPASAVREAIPHRQAGTECTYMHSGYQISPSASETAIASIAFEVQPR